ncbi:hypothetical protein VARIO8X_110145 [Burkholderiales bacterium 8X]|nr:hypothetical protein VARIO8X_110145 [Burkholderiales bacterium 8X]
MVRRLCAGPHTGGCGAGAQYPHERSHRETRHSSQVRGHVPGACERRIVAYLHAVREGRGREVGRRGAAAGRQRRVAARTRNKNLTEETRTSHE